MSLRFLGPSYAPRYNEGIIHLLVHFERCCVELPSSSSISLFGLLTPLCNPLCGPFSGSLEPMYESSSSMSDVKNGAESCCRNDLLYCAEERVAWRPIAVRPRACSQESLIKFQESAPTLRLSLRGQNDVCNTKRKDDNQSRKIYIERMSSRSRHGTCSIFNTRNGRCSDVKHGFTTYSFEAG